MSKKKNNVGFEDSRIQGFQVTEKTLESSAPRILEPFFLLFLLLLFLFPAVVSAEGISGAIEWGYSLDKVQARDSAGVVTDTENESFGQRYFLNLDKTLYPNLKFTAFGIFEKIKTNSDEDGTETETTATTKSGLLNLRLDTQLISSGIGFTRREEKVRTSPSVGSSAPQLMDTYSGRLGWRPEGFPSVDALFIRTDLYDKDRKVEDRLTDYLSVTLQYEPVKNLDLRGNFSITDTDDKLADTQSKLTSYAGKATYLRRFFNDRVSAYATYNYFRQETEVTTGGAGQVLFQVFPFSGLSAINDTPTLVTLDPNPALIDGDLTSSSGINIGPVSPGGDNRPRQIGLDFINPAAVNTIYVWVDRELPVNVSNSFRWDVYTSPDNENWTLWQTVPFAPFGGFLNRFEISFNSITARYIKVVTRPLSSAVVPPPGVDVSSIIVTEMQAFLSAFAEDVKGKQTQTSHVYDLNVKWLILDRPNLYYNFYYWGSYFDPGGISRHVMTNSLNLTHRFNRVFTGSARLAREDSEDPKKRSANVYSASLTAVPLPTLFHSIVVSGRYEDSDDGSANNNSVFLNNSAELYKGLFLNLSGGLSMSTDENDRETKTVIINSGASIVPHPTLNININYSQTDSDQTGGGREDTSTSSKRGEIAASYNPFRTLYIFASYGINEATDRDRETVQNYAVTWSPFPDGTLQFNFSYNEFISSIDQTRERSMTPSLRWYIRADTTLDVSYTDRKNRSEPEDSDEEIYFATLRIAF